MTETNLFLLFNEYIIIQEITIIKFHFLNVICVSNRIKLQSSQKVWEPRIKTLKTNYLVDFTIFFFKFSVEPSPNSFKIS